MLLNDNTRYYFRGLSVNFVLSGMPTAEVAEIAEVSHYAVSDWIKTVDEKGFEALISVKPSGRNPKLTVEQKSEIDGMIILPR